MRGRRRREESVPSSRAGSGRDPEPDTVILGMPPLFGGSPVILGMPPLFWGCLRSCLAALTQPRWAGWDEAQPEPRGPARFGEGAGSPQARSGCRADREGGGAGPALGRAPSP